MSMAKARSRNYPSLDLAEAISRARELYKKEEKHRAPASVVVNAWGYNSLNGASLRVLSALRQYGLLDGGNQDTRLTDRALALILEPEDSSAYAQALTDAMSQPSLFQDIMQEYGANPPSDATLMSYLVRKQNFTEGAARTLIQSFRVSLELVRNQTALYNGAETTTNAPMVISQQEQTNILPQRALPAGVTDKKLEFSWGNIVATVLVKTGTAAQTDVELVSQWFDLAKLSLRAAIGNPPTSQNETSTAKAENETGQA